MIYGKHATTKEHRAWADRMAQHPDWLPVIASDDGWVPWPGGECPLPNWQHCEVYLRRDNRELKITKNANEWLWDHVGISSDVIAYRPILAAETSEPEAPEWDGEGLPPVGCECEALELEDGEACWTKTTVIARSEGIVWLSGNGLQREDELKFRPIRTPAQQAEDEAVEEMRKAVAVWHPSTNMLRTLYHAGYRKETES